LNAIWGAGQWEKVLESSGPGSYNLVALSTLNSFDSASPVPLIRPTFLVEGTNFVKSTAIHFATDKLGRKDASAIPHLTENGAYHITGAIPTLSMSSAGFTTITSYILDSEFTIDLKISDDYGVNGFAFEVRFDTTLLDYVSVAGGALGSGIVNVDEANGIITGSVGPSTPVSGPQTLLSITFKASYYHVWKNLSGWQNEPTGTIYFNSADLTYPNPDPTLSYIRPGPGDINVGSDVTYTWKPIKGDVDLNGKVEIFDLTVVAGYYDVTPTSIPLERWPAAEPHYELTNPNSEQIIDLYDLVIIASNFGATSP
jgi:hypothetical protein